MTVADISEKLRMTPEALGKLSLAAHQLYNVRREPKKNGKFRLIEAPYKNLKTLQRKILKEILYSFPTHDILHGGPDTSTKSAAGAHVDKPMVMTMDIKDFFPSIKASKIRMTLAQQGLSEEAADLLTRLMTRRGRLPQGPPTSPCMARLVLAPVCEQLTNLLQKIHRAARATIYCDDLTISGSVGIHRIEKTVGRLFRRYGLTIHPEKTRKMNSEMDQVCLGIQVNRGVGPTREYLNEIDALSKCVPQNDPVLKGKRAYVAFLKRP